MSRFALIDELLPETVRIAIETVPMYSRLYKDIIMPVTRASLPSLPTIRKSDVVAAGLDALCSKVSSNFFQNTSGSTGEFLLLHRSFEEQQFIAQFYAGLNSKIQASSACTLCLGLSSHGSATAVPAPGLVLTHCVVDNRTAKNCCSYLASSFPSDTGPRAIDTIVGASTQLLLLTKYISSQGHKTSPFPVRRIVVTGDWLSQRVTDILSGFWGAHVTNRFSLSEAFGGASSTKSWNLFQFDPTIYPEIVHINSDEMAGFGELCITALHPFVQRQPLIRYRTGDLFEYSGGDFVYHGRKGQCLVNQDGSLLISGADLYELLDNCELIHRQSHSLGVTALDHSVSGKPLVKGTACITKPGELSINLNLVTKVDLAWFPRAECKLRKYLERGLHRIARAKISNLEILFSMHDNSEDYAYDKSGTIWADIDAETG